MRTLIVCVVLSIFGNADESEQLIDLSDSEKQALQKEIEEMREEAEKQKEERLREINKALLEAAVGGITIASGQEIIGLWSAYNAYTDLREGFHEYAEGARYDEKLDQLERDFLGETKNDKKPWWKFW